MEKAQCFTCWSRKKLVRPAVGKTLLCEACLAVPIEDTGKIVRYAMYKDKELKLIEIFKQLGYPQKRYRWFLKILRKNSYDVAATINYFERRDNEL